MGLPEPPLIKKKEPKLSRGWFRQTAFESENENFYRQARKPTDTYLHRRKGRFSLSQRKKNILVKIGFKNRPRGDYQIKSEWTAIQSGREEREKPAETPPIIVSRRRDSESRTAVSPMGQAIVETGRTPIRGGITFVRKKVSERTASEKCSPSIDQTLSAPDGASGSSSRALFG